MIKAFLVVEGGWNIRYIKNKVNNGVDIEDDEKL
jgi:hypothetical protein